MSPSIKLIRRLRSQAALHGRMRRRKPPRWLFPMAAERKYTKELKAIVARVQAIYAEMVLPRIPALLAQANSQKPAADSARTDGWPEALAQLLQDFRITVEKDQANRDKSIQAMAAEIATWNKGQWRKVVSATLGINIFQSEPWLQDEITAWAAENASLITTLESNAIDQVETWTMRGIRTGMRHEEIAASISERFGVSESRAEFIARDQTAKLNGNITQSRQTDLGVTGYFWRTVGDDRVRPTHEAHNGVRFNWSDPPADTGHPGEDYQCRCSPEPDLSGLLAGLNDIGEGDE